MPASAAICRPTGGLPVKLTMLVRSSVTILLPIVRPAPTTTWSVPSGRPASASSSARRSAVSGVLEAGLSTTALPPASAGATLCATRFSGKLNGEMAAITPRGSRMVQPKRFSPLGSASIWTRSPAVRLASSLAQRKVLAPRLASTRASLSGLPPSAAMMRAICSAFSSMRCDARSRIAARFQDGVQRNASAATRARSSTRSMSSSVAVGMRASSAPSHGARSVISSPVPYGPLMTRSGATMSLTRMPAASRAVVLMPILPLLRFHAGGAAAVPAGVLTRADRPAHAPPLAAPPPAGPPAVTACSSRRTGPRPRPSCSRLHGTVAGHSRGRPCRGRCPRRPPDRRPANRSPSCRGGTRPSARR